MLENFFSANSKNFSIGRMKNPSAFLIYSRGRTTKFHYGFNDLGAHSRKNLKTTHHRDSGLPDSCGASYGVQDEMLQFRRLLHAVTSSDFTA